MKRYKVEMCAGDRVGGDTRRVLNWTRRLLWEVMVG